jgi:predicted NUDIX family NTP pyrophosphohydrolase
VARSRVSAGILLYRFLDGHLEVLIAHPGGPYFARKDAGHWSIPKGEPDADEGADDDSLLAVAQREFEEETGFPVVEPPATFIALGDIVQKGGKRVIAWAVEGDLDPALAHSNTFSIEWPPRSGRSLDVPEIDRVAWLAPDEARRLLKVTQHPLVDRLEAALAARSTSAATAARPAPPRPRSAARPERRAADR